MDNEFNNGGFNPVTMGLITLTQADAYARGLKESFSDVAKDPVTADYTALTNRTGRVTLAMAYRSCHAPALLETIVRCAHKKGQQDGRKLKNFLG